MARSCVQIYFTSRRMLERLEDAECGRVFRAVLAYAEEGTEPEQLNRVEQTAFESLRVAIDRDAVHYEQKCAQLRRNGKKGGRPPKAKQMVSQKPDQEASSNSSSSSSSNSSSGSSSSLSSPPEPLPGTGDAAPDGATMTMTGTFWKFWNDNVGEPLPYHRERIEQYRRKGCADDLIQLAMERAVEQGVPRMSYVTSILDNAVASGMLTAGAYRAGGKGIGTRDGTGAPKMKNVFQRDWNAVFDEE